MPLRRVENRASAAVSSTTKAREWAARLSQLGAPLIVVVACGGRGRDDAHQSYADETMVDEITPGSDETHATSATAPSSSSEAVGTSLGATPAASSSETVRSGSSTSGSESDPSIAHESSGVVSGNDDTGSNVTDTWPNGSSSDAVGPTPALLAEGCKPGHFSSNADSCSLGTQCAEYSDWTNCSLSTSGSWLCGCHFNHPSRVYELQGMEGIDACAVTSRFCKEDDLELGEEECDSVSDGGVDTCGRTVTCGRRIAVDPALGVSMRVVDITNLACSRVSAEGPFECGCSRLDDRARHSVETDAAANACDAFSEFCLDGATEPLEAPESCVVESLTSTSYGCDLTETCAMPVASAQGATISELTPRGAHCDSSGAITSRCYCSDVYSSFAVTVPTSEASCETTSLNCNKRAEVLAAGDATCEPTSQYVHEDSCSVDLDCVQPATVDGRAVLAEGRLLAHCRRLAPGEPWWCSCASDQEAVVFEFGAPEQAPWDVCVTAPQGCMERMPVHLGAYGEFLFPVDPLENP